MNLNHTVKTRISSENTADFIHRHAIPNFPEPTSKQLRIKKILNIALQNKNFNKDKSLRKLRKNGGYINLYFKKGVKMMKKKHLPVRRSNIRIERIQTMREVGKAFIETCDYSIDSDYLFEIAYSPEQLARMIGQHHVYPPSEKYPNGRAAYDCVLNALYDYEASGQIVVVRQYDEQAGTNKASRIFLTPEFFHMLGIKRDQMIELLRELKRVKEAKGKQAESKTYGRTQANRRKQDPRVADIVRTDITKILRTIRAELLNEFILPTPVTDSVKPVRIPKEHSDTKAVETIEMTLLQQLAMIKAKIAPADYYLAEMKLKSQGLPREEMNRQLLDQLRDKLQ